MRATEFVNRTKSMRKFIVGMITVITAVVMLPTMAVAANLKNMEFSSLPGDKIEVKLIFDGTPPKADGYTIEQPARIAIDLPGTKNLLSKKSYSLGYGNARNINVIEAQGRTRLIISLSKLVEHTMRTEGDVIYVLVGSDNTKATQSSSNSMPASANTAAVATSNTGVAPPSSLAGTMQKTNSNAMITPASGVQGIDFKRGDDGAGLVVVTLGDPRTAIDISEQGDKIKIVLNKANLPTALTRRMDVIDFATPVKFVDAVQENGNSVVTIEAMGSYEQMAYQTDNTLTVSVKEVAQDELDKKKKDNFQFTGDKLSLNFQDIEVRSVLQLLADFTGLNLIASDTVKGRITLRLQNVPWDQALYLVLKTKGLDKRQTGNVLLVAPAAEITAREKLELEASKQVAELAPMKSDTIRLRYAKVSDIMKLINCKASAGSGSGSAKSSCVADVRTNTLLITDTAENIEEIRRIIGIVDIPVRQVLIEARIVNANVSYVKELGVQWTIASRLGENGFMTGRGDDLVLPSGDTRTDLLNGTARAVTLPAQGATSGVNLGYLGANTLIGLQLSAMESDDKGEVISQPRVITADGHKANITSGQQIAYTTTTGDTSNTSFKNADLTLDVTPQITPDDRIIMDIKITNDQVGSNVGGEPSIDTQSVTTQALVKNGETVVVGGIFKTENSVSKSKVPLLGDMPGIGYLFRHELNNTTKKELLIFITPKILKDDLAID